MCFTVNEKFTTMQHALVKLTQRLLVLACVQQAHVSYRDIRYEPHADSPRYRALNTCAAMLAGRDGRAMRGALCRHS